MEKEDWSYETLIKEAQESMEKAYERYFIQSHELLQRAKERRRQERGNI